MCLPRLHLLRPLAGIVAVIAGIALGGCAPPRPEGIVLVAVDTLRADRLGLYGQARATSPALDRWAAGGRVFERAQTPSPWTLPSFASIFTGRLPSGHGAGSRRRKASVTRRRALAPGVPTLAQRLAEAGYATAGFVANPFLKERFGLSRGFDTWDYEWHRSAERSVDLALEWLEGHRSERFFLFLHFMEPHLPYDPPASVAGRFVGPERHPWRRPELKEIRRAARSGSISRAHQEWIRGLYDEEVAAMDAALGRLLRHLEESGLDGSTLVVFTSDHGEELFDHGGFEHGHTVYQELLHVPLVFRGPGVEPGRVAEAVTVADLAPTLLDAAGLEPTTDGVGTSLWSCLRGRRSPPRRPLVSEETLYGPRRWAVLEWPWKLERVRLDGPERLFNLEDDPGERSDRSDDSPAVAGRLSETLDRVLRQARETPRRASAEEPELDPETAEELRQLGYVE